MGKYDADNDGYGVRMQNMEFAKGNEINIDSSKVLESFNDEDAI